MSLFLTLPLTMFMRRLASHALLSVVELLHLLGH